MEKFSEPVIIIRAGYYEVYEKPEFDKLCESPEFANSFGELEKVYGIEVKK